MAIKLNAKVANALDQMKAQGFSDILIMKAVLDSESDEDGILKYAELSDIMKALTDGYEAKPSPEEAIAAYYEDAKQAAWDAEDISDNAGMREAHAKQEAVEFVLNELGIRIKGVQ